MGECPALDSKHRPVPARRPLRYAGLPRRRQARSIPRSCARRHRSLRGRLERRAVERCRQAFDRGADEGRERDWRSTLALGLAFDPVSRPAVVEFGGDDLGVVKRRDEVSVAAEVRAEIDAARRLPPLECEYTTSGQLPGFASGFQTSHGNVRIRSWSERWTV